MKRLKRILKIVKIVSKLYGKIRIHRAMEQNMVFERVTK